MELSTGLVLTKDSKYNKRTVLEILNKSMQSGIYINVSKLENYFRKYTEDLSYYRKVCFDNLGFALNLDYDKDIKSVLCSEFKYEGSTNIADLKELYAKTEEPFIYNLIKYKETHFNLYKVKEIIKYLDDSDRVHPMISLGNTNRIYYSNPSITNIPYDIRDILGTEKGYSIIHADYKAFEVYILINMLGIDILKNIYANYDDFYTGILRELTNETVDDKYRDTIKTAWLSGIYGSSLDNIGETKEEQRLVEVVKSLISNLPEIGDFKQMILNKAIYGKPIYSYFGTLLNYSCDIERLQNVVFNSVFQTTGSDLLFFACESCYNAFRNMGYSFNDIHIYYTLHDEIIFYVKNTLLSDDLLSLIKESMAFNISGWISPKLDITVNVENLPTSNEIVF